MSKTTWDPSSTRMPRNQSCVHRDRKAGRTPDHWGRTLPGEGFFIKPTVIADIQSVACVFQEEIFGPVLAVTKARDFDHALELANDCEYGLTGAVFTTNPEKIEKAKRQFFVGNLYINRKCTGAMVGAHPFGGFNMSGTDSKAGGPGLSASVRAGQVDCGKNRLTLPRAILELPRFEGDQLVTTLGSITIDATKGNLLGGSLFFSLALTGDAIPQCRRARLLPNIFSSTISLSLTNYSQIPTLTCRLK